MFLLIIFLKKSTSNENLTGAKTPLFPIESAVSESSYIALIEVEIDSLTPPLPLSFDLFFCLFFKEEEDDDDEEEEEPYGFEGGT